MKYELQEEKENESTFFLYKEDDNRLFVFGNDDIWVGKKGNKAICNQDNICCYDYEGTYGALIGRIIWNKGEEDKTERIIVIQFQ